MDIDKCPLTPEARHSMIAQAAYMKSRQRDYPGDPVADWLQAEAEIGRALAEYCQSVDQDRDFSTYQRFRSDVRRMLAKAETVINADAVTQALEKASGQMRQAGESIPASVDRAAKTVKHELMETIGKLGHAWDNFRVKQSDLLSNWKEKGMQTLDHKAKSFQDWLERWQNKNNH